MVFVAAGLQVALVAGSGCSRLQPSPQDSAMAVTYYVAPQGDDTHPGSRAQPFATIERARDAIRELKKGTDGLPAGGVTVRLRGGVHPRQATFALTAEDSGTPDAPVVYASAPGETATLFGGTALQRSWFVPVPAGALLERVIAVEARNRLLQCDLRGHGITDYGELSRHGHHKANLGKTPPVELYVNGERLTRARWPNPDDHYPDFLRGVQKHRRGVVGRSGIIDPGPGMNDPDFLKRGGVISYAFERPALWSKADDIWLDGVFTWSWEWSYNQVAKIDHEKRQITLRYGEVGTIADKYSFDYFFAENLLEEIDLPGEYYLDRNSGMLYLLPPEGFERAAVSITLSVLAVPMVRLEGASHVVFRDLLLDAGRGSGIVGTGGEGVLVERCGIRNLSGTGVSLNGKGHGVRACHIHHVGGAGVSLQGGTPETLEPSGCFVEDSDIHLFAWYGKVYTSAVALGYRSVGSRISHNRIRHGPHVAIVVYGNDHLIEYNDVGHVVEDFTDMGAIYANLGEWPLERGTVIRRNYFHHIGQQYHLQNAVYPDNMTMGWRIEENVFHRIGGAGEASNCRAINNNTGAHIITRHNVFIDCTIPYLMGTFCSPAHERNVQGWKEYFAGRDLSRLLQAQRYPELLCFWDEPRQYPDTNTFERNLIYNPTVPLLRRYGKVEMQEGAIIEAGGVLRTADNWITDTDPGFVDAAAGDFALRPDAPVFARLAGFPAIPFGQIGPRVPFGPAGGGGQ
jgi:hypothetical protein